MEIQDELCLFKDGNHEDDSVCLNTDTPSLLKTENKDQNLNYCVEAPSTEMLGMLKSDIQDSCENLSDTSEKDENETNPNSGKYRLSKTKQVEQNCDAEKCDQNLNATKTSCTDTFDILPSDTQDIDENIRNTLAESENTTNANNIVAETCNSNKKSYTIQESLIKKSEQLGYIGAEAYRCSKEIKLYGNSSDEEDNIDIDKNWQLNVADSSSDSDSDSDSNDSIESISDGSDDTGSHVSFGQNDKGAIKKGHSQSDR
ncbi:hypothetical protein NQ317_015753 [Molorchus minor]|uniref:Uncharacterized protein n=1 Tax=Molorchus minor TaxID=1323400 RepID=A0ABQ9K3U0_9CUCU|nr:hypothetical protein NQ317_015753 [Molorchus minor]